MKKLKRLDHCLNCGTPTGENINFCPQCGQENVNKRQPFWSILVDAITGFFSIDSKTFRSIFPLLFKPGFLTNEFVAGRLVNYVHPARMFITITIIYFLVFSMFNRKTETFKVSFPEDRVVNGDTNNINLNFGDLNIDYFRVMELMKAGVTDVNTMADSIQLEKTFWNKLMLRQVMKSKAMSREAFLSYYKSRLPWIMFAIMPVFAIIMKLIYIRRKRLFIDHLVFAYHYHSFVFLLMLIGLLLLKIWPGIPQWPFALWILWYLLRSMIKVYDDSFFKAFLRFFLISILYIFAGALVFLISLFALFILF